MTEWRGVSSLLAGAVRLALLSGLTASGAGSAAAQAAGTVPTEYIGAGSCSASSCHGSVRPRNETRIQQNEHTIWVQDRHRRAFEVLSNPVSVRMGKILGRDVLKADSPSTSPRCLACHGLPPDQKRRTTFDMNDGVSCELCHGPASNWLGPHTASTADRAKDHARNVQLGLVDTRDLVKRTQQCLTCHLGSSKPYQNVDHELIAAGHPDLVFELDSFSAVMPRHWKEPYDSDPWRGARTWSTGAATQLGAQMGRIAGRAKGEFWPEYSELDCFACHHSLTKAEDSWRLLEGDYYGRRSGYRTGDPPFNDSRYAVFRQMVQVADGSVAQRLDSEMTKLATLMSKLNPPREEVVATAGRVAEIANGLAQKFDTMSYEPAAVLRAMRAICGDAENIALQGPRVAEHATMALDSLFIAYAKAGGGLNEREVRAAVNGLYQQLDDPSAYDARRFAAALRRVGATLR